MALYHFTVNFHHFALDMPSMIAQNADFQQIFNQRLSFEFTSHISEFLLKEYGDGYHVQVTVHAENTKDMVLVIEVRLQGPPAIFANLRSTIIPFLKQNQSNWIKDVMKDITYTVKPKIRSDIPPSEQEKVHELEKKIERSLPPTGDDTVQRKVFLNIDKDTFVRTLYLVFNRPYQDKYDKNDIKIIVNAAVTPERTEEQQQDARRKAQLMAQQLMAQQFAVQEPKKKKKAKSKNKKSKPKSPKQQHTQSSIQIQTKQPLPSYTIPQQFRQLSDPFKDIDPHWDPQHYFDGFTTIRQVHPQLDRPSYRRLYQENGGNIAQMMEHINLPSRKPSRPQSGPSSGPSGPSRQSRQSQQPQRSRPSSRQPSRQPQQPRTTILPKTQDFPVEVISLRCGPFQYDSLQDFNRIMGAILAEKWGSAMNIQYELLIRIALWNYSQRHNVGFVMKGSMALRYWFGKKYEDLQDWDWLSRTNDFDFVLASRPGNHESFGHKIAIVEQFIDKIRQQFDGITVQQIKKEVEKIYIYRLFHDKRAIFDLVVPRDPYHIQNVEIINLYYDRLHGAELLAGVLYIQSISEILIEWCQKIHRYSRQDKIGPNRIFVQKALDRMYSLLRSPLLENILAKLPECRPTIDLGLRVRQNEKVRP